MDICYLLPALLHSPDGRVTRRGGFAYFELGDIVVFLPWLMTYTGGVASRIWGATREASETWETLEEKI